MGVSETTESKSRCQYILERAAGGGFIVWNWDGDQWNRRPLFACSKVDEAYSFMDAEFERI